MLKKIDQADIENLDDAQRQNLMVNAEGEYVFAQSDEKAWKRHLEAVKASEAAQKKQQVGDKELQDRGLECPIDKRLFVDPMKTPCCGETYCHDCIENALLENDLTCPGCETENVSLERLEPDEEVKKKIKDFEVKKAAVQAQPQSPSATTDTPQDRASPSESRPGSQDGTITPPSTTGSAKKRSASEIDAITSSSNLAAPAMKRQKSGDAVSSTTFKLESKTGSKTDDIQEVAPMAEINNPLPANMMPPDFSQMQQSNNNMNFPMMAGFNPMMMNPMMMGIGGMNFMNPMMMNGINPGGMGMNMGTNMNFPDQTSMQNNWNMNPNMNTNMNQNQAPNSNIKRPQLNNNNTNQNTYNKFPTRPNNRAPQCKPPQPTPAGLTGVPTGPKAMNQQPASNFNQQNNNNFYPPSGPAGTRFSNQQRHVGNEEDNAYMRQPVNPHRHGNKNKRPRQADYREL